MGCVCLVCEIVIENLERERERQRKLTWVCLTPSMFFHLLFFPFLFRLSRLCSLSLSHTQRHLRFLAFRFCSSTMLYIYSLSLSLPLCLIYIHMHTVTSPGFFFCFHPKHIYMDNESNPTFFLSLFFFYILEYIYC